MQGLFRWPKGETMIEQLEKVKIMESKPMNSDQISLLEYQGLYITVGFGWKTALHKFWGHARIPAQVMKAGQ